MPPRSGNADETAARIIPISRSLSRLLKYPVQRRRRAVLIELGWIQETISVRAASAWKLVFMPLLRSLAVFRFSLRVLQSGGWQPAFDAVLDGFHESAGGVPGNVDPLRAVRHRKPN
jgi:hypothetical protein